MTEKCDNCRFRHSVSSDGQVTCHRYPKVRTKASHDWCGEWKPKKQIKLDVCPYIAYKDERNICPATAIACPGWAHCPYYKSEPQEHWKAMAPAENGHGPRHIMWFCSRCGGLTPGWIMTCDQCGQDRPERCYEPNCFPHYVNTLGSEYLIWVKVEDNEKSMC